ncbi:hypothetical protein Y024_4637 [Burkholderia pseudomallei TSV44]|nr:hypothetical protein Y048_3095 [Burkholderia pseudomallei MSHR456]KGX56168.1 hypothetical protein Y024_4637 [Burkholderia pseudomallei TSV44]
MKLAPHLYRWDDSDKLADAFLSDIKHLGWGAPSLPLIQ